MLIRQRQGVEIATEKPEFQHKKCQSIAKTHNVFYFSEDCISLTVFSIWSNQMNASSKYIINNVGNVHCVSSQNAIFVFVFSRRRHHDGTSIICHTIKCSCSKQLRALAQRSEEICRQLIGKIGRETCHVTRVFFFSLSPHLLISSFLLSTPCSALAAGILLLIMVLLIWPILVTCVTITLESPYLCLFIYSFIIYFLLVFLVFSNSLLQLLMWISFISKLLRDPNLMTEHSLDEVDSQKNPTTSKKIVRNPNRQYCTRNPIFVFQLRNEFRNWFYEPPISINTNRKESFEKRTCRRYKEEKTLQPTTKKESN